MQQMVVALNDIATCLKVLMDKCTDTVVHVQASTHNEATEEDKSEGAIDKKVVDDDHGLHRGHQHTNRDDEDGPGGGSTGAHGPSVPIQALNTAHGALTNVSTNASHIVGSGGGSQPNDDTDEAMNMVISSIDERTVINCLKAEKRMTQFLKRVSENPHMQIELMSKRKEEHAGQLHRLIC